MLLLCLVIHIYSNHFPRRDKVPLFFNFYIYALSEVPSWVKINSQLRIHRIRYWCLRNIPYAREDISIDLLMRGTGRETRTQDPKWVPVVGRISEYRQVAAIDGPNIGTLELFLCASPFNTLRRKKQKEKKGLIKMEKKRTPVCRATHTDNSSSSFFSDLRYGALF